MNIKRLNIQFKETSAMTILIVVALLWLCQSVSATEKDTNPGNDMPSDLTVSLITCAPGEEIYELCGHSAIRVRGEGIDSVWNYGLFNFNEPNFVYRFVKGETDYMVAGYPFSWFLPEYERAGRQVIEQDLNFTPQEAREILRNLRIAAMPENSRYRYNYVKDNCSTRIINQIDNASSVDVIYPDTIEFGTFRNEMRHFHKGYPWYQFGIDLALGSGLDYPLSPREEMFVPVILKERASKAYFADGRPLVKEERILNKGVPDATLPPTSWWGGSLFWSWFVTGIALLAVAYAFWKWRIPKLFYFIWFFILGISGFLVAFLVFISVHEATSPNALIFWLNPFQLVFCIGLFSKKIRILSEITAWYNMVVVTILLIVWPFINQSANPGFFPLMGSTALLGATYAIIVRKSSYKINKTVRTKHGSRNKKKKH